MQARDTRTHRRRTLAIRPGLATVLLAWGTALAAEPPDRPPSPMAQRGAWQRVQHGPHDAITLVRARQAAQAPGAQDGRVASPHSGFVADRGGIAWQLEGGGRLTLRRRHRTPMLFYRNDF